MAREARWTAAQRSTPARAPGAGGPPADRAGRAPAPDRTRAAAALAGQAPLLRCTAGPHVLLFDLRTLRHIDYVAADVPLLPSGQGAASDAAEVDLRRVLGVAPGPAQALLFSLPDDPALRRLVVDAGSLRLLRLELARIVPLPPLLARAPALRAVRATVALEDGALGWLVDPSRLVTGAGVP